MYKLALTPTCVEFNHLVSLIYDARTHLDAHKYPYAATKPLITQLLTHAYPHTQPKSYIHNQTH